MDDVLYVNGRFTVTGEKVIGVEDRGFQFGDGVYETMKFARSRPLFLSAHYERLTRGLAALDIPSPFAGIEAFSSMCAGILERTSFAEGIVYVQVTRGDSERSHFYPDRLTPTVVAYSRRFRFPDAVKKERGITVVTTEDIRWKLCHVKTVNLLGNVLAKKKAERAGADEALFVTRDGLVTEGASSSFFAVTEGKVRTHPSDCSILPGTVRDEVITLALAHRIRVDERALHENQLFMIEEAFITSTTQGVIPVTTINGRKVGEGMRGIVTAELQRLYDEREQREISQG